MSAGNFSTLERILRSVVVNELTGCWEWTLTKEPPPNLPYGRLYFGKKYRYVHRVMYELKVGPVPEGMCVCHRCDVPFCVNPEHLWIGTNTENIADRDAKNRQAKGERSGQHTHPERTARGLRHGSYTKPESRRNGENNGRAKVTYAIAQMIREERAMGATLQLLADKYRVGTSTIHRIVIGVSWGISWQ